MKRVILHIILFLPALPILNANNYLIESTEDQLYKVLDFIDKKYFEIHFDGLLGVTLAHAFLRNTLIFPIEENDKQKLTILIKKCQTIQQKIYPLLPNSPKYMITFRRKLLDANEWSKTIPKELTWGKIKHLGYYKNWTSDTIKANKKALFKGVKSDVCLREILELSEPDSHCYISKICREMMLDPQRVDKGYLLTHRLLYLQVVRLQKCEFYDLPKNITEYTRAFCSYIYKEAVTSEKLGFPYHDIFLEQVVLCGMESYAEFLNENWLRQIAEWQNPYGCYESIGNNFTKRTSFNIDFGCSDHTTGLGAAALALHLRHLLWPNVFYKIRSEFNIKI